MSVTLESFQTLFLTNKLDFYDRTWEVKQSSSYGGNQWFRDDRLDVNEISSERFTLAALATRTLTRPGATAGLFYFVWGYVEGDVTLTLVGTEMDGSTATTQITPIYGTAKWPGIIFASTRYITSLTVTGVGTSSVCEFFVGQYLEPNDASLP